MAILRQFGLKSGNFEQGAASFCNYAGQMRYEQPWSAKSDAPTILLLPGFERGLFDMNGGTNLHDTMSEPGLGRLLR
jgi:hypothetical protein